ncbi:MAG: hypothetical protein KME05_24680 [Gloeocapsa sp. UFS-A4-WI-NPMV-4B04]|jgi:hypothetical protein|nr:hypothetical protein [Gloeocapsa sp. UFS-A4-WI-NPMV-4B04]
MTYEQLKRLKPSAFKRRCGVHPETSDFGVSAHAGAQSKMPTALLFTAVHNHILFFLMKVSSSSTWVISGIC